MNTHRDAVDSSSFCLWLQHALIQDIGGLPVPSVTVQVSCGHALDDLTYLNTWICSLSSSNFVLYPLPISLHRGSLCRWRWRPVVLCSPLSWLSVFSLLWPSLRTSLSSSPWVSLFHFFFVCVSLNVFLLSFILFPLLCSWGGDEIQIRTIKNPFTLTKNPLTPNNIWLLSNDSALVTGIYWLQLRLAVMETWHPGRHVHFHPFSALGRLSEQTNTVNRPVSCPAQAVTPRLHRARYSYANVASHTS